MAKWASDATIDGGLDYIQQTAKKVYVCTTAAITTYAHAATDYNLTTGKAVTSTHFTKADSTGAGGGRKITLAQQSSLGVSTSGTAGHVAVTSSDTLLYVTTCTTQALTSGNNVTIPAWRVDISDPT
jgi:hypothetical protein